MAVHQLKDLELPSFFSVFSSVSRESEFPPTEESGLETPPTEDNHTLPFPEEIHVDVGVSSSTPSYFYLVKTRQTTRRN